MEDIEYMHVRARRTPEYQGTGTAEGVIISMTPSTQERESDLIRANRTGACVARPNRLRPAGRSPFQAEAETATWADLLKRHPAAAWLAGHADLAAVMDQAVAQSTHSDRGAAAIRSRRLVSQ